MKTEPDFGSLLMCLSGAVLLLIGAIGAGLGRAGGCHITLAGMVLVVGGILSQNLEKE